MFLVVIISLIIFHFLVGDLLFLIAFELSFVFAALWLYYSVSRCGFIYLY